MTKKGNVHPTRIFKEPDDLEAAFEEYKKDIKKQSQEWQKVQYVGSRGIRKSDPLKVPYTLAGFNRFCRNNYGNVEQYFVNKDGYYNDFVSTCYNIKTEIRENQIIGGLLGFYNPSITQHLNSLVNRTETKVTHKIENITGMIIKY